MLCVATLNGLRIEDQQRIYCTAHTLEPPVDLLHYFPQFLDQIFTHRTHSQALDPAHLLINSAQLRFPQNTLLRSGGEFKRSVTGLS